MREYKVPPRVAPTAEVRLDDGMVLTWTKPKESLGLLRLRERLDGSDSDGVLIVKSTLAIIDQMEEGLPPEQVEYLEARLRDPDDDFNLPDLRAIINMFQEDTSGLPPTSGGDSGEQ